MTDHREDGLNIRELVLDILLEMDKTQEYGNLLIRNVLDKYNYLDGNKKAFLKRLTEGVVERRIQLEYALECFSSVPMRKCKPVIRNLLRMGAYQILFMDSVPDSAACNEAVKLAVRRKFQSLKGFVNGVLRNLARNKDAISWPDRNKEPVKYLSVLYSMPEWIIEMWIRDYGEADTEKILQGVLEERPVTIRLSEQITADEKAEVLTGLAEAGCSPAQHPYLSYAYALERSEGIAALPGFAEGRFTVQDVSSMLVAECSGVKKSDSEAEEILAIDVCAAPGGKAVHTAECLLDRGMVIARDLTEYKAFYIMDNAERMNLPNLEVQVWDATVADEELFGKADLVIADLPCSGLGVIGRKADIKYRVTPESLAEVAALQRDILSVVQNYVKPGGILLYSTCTINKGENEENTDWFADHFSFEPVPLLQQISPDADGAREIFMESAARIQLLPGIHKTDGFFISCFRRKV